MRQGRSTQNGIEPKILAYVVGHYCISQRRACKLVKMSRSTLYYLPVRDARPVKRPGFRGGSNTGEWSHEEVPEVFA